MLRQRMKALKSQGISMWANSQFVNREHMDRLLSGYLWGCPIPMVSASGVVGPLFKNADNSAAAERMDRIANLLGVESVFHYQELRQIARWLKREGRDDNSVPKGNREFICFSESATGVLKDTYGLYGTIKKDELKAAERKPYASLLTLDALFRHIRNAFAHGYFTEVYRKNASGVKATFVYFQDVNREGQITARGYISYEHLLKVIKLIRVQPI